MAEFPAVVLGNYITALGVIRSLGRHGIQLFWASECRDFVRASRWCRCLPRSVGAFAQPSRLPELLGALDIDRAVLIPCADHWTREISWLDPEVARRFPASVPPWESLKHLMDKALLARKLAEAGIPHPTTVALKGEGDLDYLRDRDLSRWFLKPRDSQAFQATFKRKALWMESLENAGKLFDCVRKSGLQVVMQEYVPGPASHHFFLDGFVDRHHKIRTIFARRRLRMYPEDFGDSSYMTSVALDQVASAVQSLRKLFEEVTYRGIFSVEFKQDSRDGQFKLIEVNTRPWAYIEFAAQCGVDVTMMAYADSLGWEIPETTAYRVGRSTAVWPNDLVAGLGLIRAGELSAWSWIKSQFEALPAMFSWDDPGPDLNRLVAALVTKVRNGRDGH